MASFQVAAPEEVEAAAWKRMRIIIIIISCRRCHLLAGLSWHLALTWRLWLLRVAAAARPAPAAGRLPEAPLSGRAP